MGIHLVALITSLIIILVSIRLFQTIRSKEGFTDQGVWIINQYTKRVYWMPSNRSSKHWLPRCDACPNIPGCNLVSEIKTDSEINLIPDGEAFRCDMTTSFCGLGKFCPVGSPKGQSYKCPAGRYGSTTNLQSDECSGICRDGCVCPSGSINDCPLKCPAGYYCPSGTGGILKPLVCPNGFYCLEGSSKPTPCPAGMSCPVGTSSI
jgi:hypothetical protein